MKKNKLDKSWTSTANSDVIQNILDMREHDVPYHVRTSIDLKLFVGLWYSVKMQSTKTPVITRKQDMLAFPVHLDRIHNLSVTFYCLVTSRLAPQRSDVRLISFAGHLRFGL